MTKETTNNIRLGIFVFIGMMLIISALYVIGKNRSLFGSNFKVKARFKNVNGLLPGNNVRFSGIQAGTVKKIKIINDTLIEVDLLLDKDITPYIHKNSTADLGSEGLIGNKVVNILPGSGTSPLIEEGDLLYMSNQPNAAEIMQTLSKTNNNVSDISEELKLTVHRLNNSTALWSLLNDSALSNDLKASLANIHKASSQANDAIADINTIVRDAKNGKGTVGELLSDKEMAASIKDATAHIRKASQEADQMMAKLDSLVADIQRDVHSGPGTIHALLKDPVMAAKLSSTVTNIEKGTALFSEDMEALKHNFLTRGYFRKQEKENKKKAK
jgi:phospholipid/cholesterol/gamma-HCH transport system substrate-binding protein